MCSVDLIGLARRGGIKQNRTAHKFFRKKEIRIMKGKKLLAGVLSAAMVLGTMALPVFADGETDVYTIGAGKTYETFADALNADDTDSDGVITYKIYGKVVLPDGGIKLGKDGITTINFTKGSEDAELSLEGTGFNLIGFDHAADLKAINYTGLKLSRLNGSWVGDAAHLNQFFTTTIRTNSDGIVTYTDCTFPNGSGSNTYGKTVYNNCIFSNENADTKYNVWIRGGETEINGGTVKGAAGIKLYSDDKTKVFGDTKIDGVNFEDITKKPAIVATQQGKIEIKNSTVSNCEYGLIANESNQGAALADITVDGKAPAYVSSVDGNLYTEIKYADKEAADKGTTAETIVAMVKDKYYATIDEAVAAAQAATTDKWSIAKITLLTNDALDISKGPDNYVSYNITKNDTVVTGERIADDAHKSYYKLTNASTLYIPADVNSLILENVKNLCSIEIAKGADVTLKLNGDNELAGNIFVPEGAKLTIEDITADGTGRLAVYNTTTKEFVERKMNAFGAGDGYSAAIGGSQTQPGGEIVIKSGEIEAYSNYGAAIGGGQQGTAKVTIRDGKIKAEASYGTAIGGGQQSTGDVTISGGVIDAKSDRSAPIGGGNQAAGDSNIIISGGDITVARDFGTNLFGNSTGESAGAKISGGTFNTDVSDYCEDGFSPKFVNGKYAVDDSADTLKLTFKKHADDESVYDIVLNGDGKDINRLNTVHFTFALDNPNMTYAIKTAKGMSTIYPDNNEYVFYYDGKDGFGDTDRPDTAQNITIGTVTFDGFGKFTFKATAGKATATTTADNLVTEFVTTGEAGKGALKIGEDDNMIKDAEIKVPTQKLTVNVAMEHNVGDNTEAYQDMTVAISGGDLAGKVLEYKLGDDANTAITKAMNGAMVASYQIKADLTKDRIYTVTVSGAGYRTSRYTVTMTEDKTMNFWNNDKTNEVTVIDDEKAKTTFLAGELVRDGKIDIYDLSAVVAYFGQKNIDKTQASKFAKYDLNRDGEIDIMDISIVLTSWGK